jgi:predicted dehydrogenase
MSGKLNRGIIGTGFIAEKFAEQLPEAPGAGLPAVGSLALEPAEDFCSRRGDRPRGSYDEFLADPGGRCHLYLPAKSPVP